MNRSPLNQLQILVENRIEKVNSMSTEKGQIPSGRHRAEGATMARDDMFPTATIQSPPVRRNVRRAAIEIELPFDAPEAKLHGRALTQEEQEELEASELSEQLEEYRLELARLENAARLFSIPDWLRAIVSASLAFVAIAVFLLLSAKILSGIKLVLSLPSPFSWVFGTLYGALLLFAIYFLCRCAWLLLKNRRSILGNLSHHNELRKRGRLQEQAKRHEREAIKELCSYLHEYNIDDRCKKALMRWGMTKDGIERLSSVRSELLESSGISDTGHWIQRFQKDFQESLDYTARQIVKKSAIRAGVATASSPDPMLDRLIIIGLTIGMYMQLLELYRIRPSAGSVLTLLLRSFSHAYLVVPVVQYGSDALADDISEQLAQLGGNVAAGVAGRLAAKGSEGLLHALLVRKLGKAAISQISPTRRRS